MCRIIIRRGRHKQIRRISYRVNKNLFNRRVSVIKMSIAYCIKLHRCRMINSQYSILTKSSMWRGIALAVHYHLDK